MPLYPIVPDRSELEAGESSRTRAQLELNAALERVAALETSLRQREAALLAQAPVAEPAPAEERSLELAVVPESAPPIQEGSSARVPALVSQQSCATKIGRLLSAGRDWNCVPLEGDEDATESAGDS